MKLLRKNPTFLCVLLMVFSNLWVTVKGIDCWQCKNAFCDKNEVAVLKPCVKHHLASAADLVPDGCKYFSTDLQVMKRCVLPTTKDTCSTNGKLNDCVCRQNGCNKDMCKCDLNGKPEISSSRGSSSQAGFCVNTFSLAILLVLYYPYLCYIAL